MLTRIIAALALIPLLIVIVIGGLPLYLAEFLIVAMALHEFYKAFNEKEINPLYKSLSLFKINNIIFILIFLQQLHHSHMLQTPH